MFQIDNLILSFDNAIRTLHGVYNNKRPNPAADIQQPELSDADILTGFPGLSTTYKSTKSRTVMKSEKSILYFRWMLKRVDW